MDWPVISLYSVESMVYIVCHQRAVTTAKLTNKVDLGKERSTGSPTSSHQIGIELLEPGDHSGRVGTSNNNDLGIGQTFVVLLDGVYEISQIGQGLINI